MLSAADLAGVAAAVFIANLATLAMAGGVAKVALNRAQPDAGAAGAILPSGGTGGLGGLSAESINTDGGDHGMSASGDESQYTVSTEDGDE